MSNRILKYSLVLIALLSAGTNKIYGEEITNDAQSYVFKDPKAKDIMDFLNKLSEPEKKDFYEAHFLLMEGIQQYPNCVSNQTRSGATNQQSEEVCRKESLAKFEQQVKEKPLMGLGVRMSINGIRQIENLKEQELFFNLFALQSARYGFDYASLLRKKA